MAVYCQFVASQPGKTPGSVSAPKLEVSRDDQPGRSQADIARFTTTTLGRV